MTQPADRSDDDAPGLEEGTDVTAESDAAGVGTPATSDPDEMTDDGRMGGTGGENAGGAG